LCCLGHYLCGYESFHEDEIKKALLENESSFIFVDSANGLPIMPNVYPYNGFSVYLPKDQFYNGMIVELSTTVQNSSVSSALKSIGVRETSHRNGRSRQRIFDLSVLAAKTESSSDCKPTAVKRINSLSGILNDRLTFGNQVMQNGDSTWYLKSPDEGTSISGYNIGYQCRGDVLYLIVAK